MYLCVCEGGVGRVSKHVFFLLFDYHTYSHVFIQGKKNNNNWVKSQADLFFFASFVQS